MTLCVVWVQIRGKATVISSVISRRVIIFSFSVSVLLSDCRLLRGLFVIFTSFVIVFFLFHIFVNSLTVKVVKAKERRVSGL